MHHWTPVDNRGRCVQILSGAFTQFIQRRVHNLVGPGIFALCVVHRVQAIEQQVQLLVDFTEGQRPVNAKFCRGSILAQTATKPDLRRQIANPIEQNAMVMSVIAFNQHQHGFRFVKTGEVPEITALAVRVFTVRAARRFRRGKNQRGAAGLHLCQ